MKPTDKQLLVLNRLMKGWSIYTEHNQYTGRHGQLVYQSWTYYMCDELDKGFCRVHHSTISSLSERGFIDIGSPYHITELGKKTTEHFTDTEECVEWLDKQEVLVNKAEYLKLQQSERKINKQYRTLVKVLTTISSAIKVASILSNKESDFDKISKDIDKALSQ